MTITKKKKSKPKSKKRKDEKCPFCTITDSLKGKMDAYNEIIEHFSKAKVEVLEGFKKIINSEMDIKAKKKRGKNSRVKINDN